MNYLVYAKNDFNSIFNFLNTNPDVKINGVYETKKKFKDEFGNWYDTSSFISITSNKKYDDLSSLFKLDSKDEKYSSANYLNLLINANPKIINFEETKNLAFFNNKDFSSFKNLNELEFPSNEFSFDSSKDFEKRIAYNIADLYTYSDLTCATNYFNDKLMSNRNYACNYLKKQFREKGINTIIANLDLIPTLNIDNENNKEIEARIDFIKDSLKEINKKYDTSTLGKLRNLISYMEGEGFKNFITKEEKEMVDNALNDSIEFRKLYNRLVVVNEVKKKEKEVANKQAFGRNAKDILTNIKYDEIKAKRIELFNSIETYSPDEYIGLIPEWLINKCNQALEKNNKDEFFTLKAKYFNNFFVKADKELNKRYELLEFISNTPIMTLSVHHGAKKEYKENNSQYDWTNPNTLKDYTNDEKYINKVPKEFQDLKRFVGYKLEWVESGRNWKDEYGIDVLDSRGNPIKQPLFDNEGNILVDDNGFPIFEGKFAKIPYSCLTGKKTKTNAPEEWCNYEEAIIGIRKFGLHGLGIELGGEGSERVVGLDIDHIYNDKGEISFEAHEVLGVLMNNAWIEKSISGTGLHAIIKGNYKVPEGQKRVGNFEMYDSDRFFTISGKDICLKIENSNEGVKGLREIHKRFMNKSEDKIYKKEENLLKVEYKEEKELYDINTIINKAYASWDRRKSSNNGANKFDDIFNGNFYGYFKETKKVDDKLVEVEGSQNIADYWLINQVRFFGATKKQADEIMRMSGLMRDKWDSIRGNNETYGSQTIDRVFKDNTLKIDSSYMKNKNNTEKEKR